MIEIVCFFGVYGCLLVVAITTEAKCDNTNCVYWRISTLPCFQHNAHLFSQIWMCSFMCWHSKGIWFRFFHLSTCYSPCHTYRKHIRSGNRHSWYQSALVEFLLYTFENAQSKCNFELWWCRYSNYMTYLVSDEPLGWLCSYITDIRNTIHSWKKCHVDNLKSKKLQGEIIDQN